MPGSPWYLDSAAGFKCVSPRRGLLFPWHAGAWPGQPGRHLGSAAARQELKVTSIGSPSPVSAAHASRRPRAAGMSPVMPAAWQAPRLIAPGHCRAGVGPASPHLTCRTEWSVDRRRCTTGRNGPASAASIRGVQGHRVSDLEVSDHDWQISRPLGREGPAAGRCRASRDADSYEDINVLSLAGQIPPDDGRMAARHIAGQPARSRVPAPATCARTSCAPTEATC